MQENSEYYIKRSVSSHKDGVSIIMKRLGIVFLFCYVGLICGATIHAQQSNPVVPTPASENLTPELKNPALKGFNATIIGEILWEGHKLTQTNVSVYRDEKLKDLYTSGISKQGQFALRLEPGSYYLVAYVDVDQSGKFDEGDAYGVLGVKNWEDKKQKHQAVDLGANAELKGIKIHISARLQRIGEDLKLVPEKLYQPSEFKKFTTELSQATAGCRGTLILTQKVEPNVHKIVIAYTDTSWKYQAGISIADPNTTAWELRLKPGKYYLMAVVDKNRNNKLDTGDTYGFYGVKDLHKRGAFPKPVLVKRHTFTENLEIQVSATYTKNDEKNQQRTSQISGRIVPTPQNATKVQVEVYTSSALVNPIATATTDTDGQFTIKLPVGEYYVIANHDVDANGKYSEGDRLGGFGTDAITTKPPSPLALEAGETRAIYIQMSARYDVEGQLVEYNTDDEKIPSGNIRPNGISETPDTEQMGSITGKITSYFSTKKSKSVNMDTQLENQHPTPDGLLSLSTTPDFRKPMWMPLFIDETGTFLVDVKPGRYYVMAILDQNSDGRSGLSDGIGIYGTHQPVRGNPATITVFPGKTTPHVDIDILASYVDEKGTMSELSDGDRWNIARMYGKPEDIFNYTDRGKQIEEWMYWTTGLAFQFEGDGAGWKLKHRETFEPNTQIKQNGKQTQEEENKDNSENIQQNSDREVSTDGFSLATESVYIFYSHEGVLWRIAPASYLDRKILNRKGNTPSEEQTDKVNLPLLNINTRVAPLGSGLNPSASDNGILLYQDPNRNVIISDVDTAQSTVLLDSRQLLAQDVSISPDGEYIAFSNGDNSGRKRIVIQHLRSEKTFLIPSTSLEMSNPTWRRDGQLLAYATAGSVENPKADSNRNIYAFDNVLNSVEPIVISPEDDAEPSWHPTDQNMLAFSRGDDDNTRQIWVVNMSSIGEPIEEQITEMGGSRPVWVPPKGRWILYENNGQLWTVDVTTPGSEFPLISNGKAVFGYQPTVVHIK